MLVGSAGGHQVSAAPAASPRLGDPCPWAVYPPLSPSASPLTPTTNLHRAALTSPPAAEVLLGAEANATDPWRTRPVGAEAPTAFTVLGGSSRKGQPYREQEESISAQSYSLHVQRLPTTSVPCPEVPGRRKRGDVPGIWMGDARHHPTAASGRGSPTRELAPSWHEGGHHGEKQELLPFFSSPGVLLCPGGAEKVAESSQGHESFVARSLLQNLQQEPPLKDLGCEGPQQGSAATGEDTRFVIIKFSIFPTKYLQRTNPPRPFSCVSYLLLPGASGGGRRGGEAGSAWLGDVPRVTALREEEAGQRGNRRAPAPGSRSTCKGTGRRIRGSPPGRRCCWGSLLTSLLPAV